ncbi:hypothetical protein SDC9_45672 [bioreactor metagenome]|uniref:RHS repeat-associated core domain-containing protein n=1 Tax=bioreactor metagenome TaxID=1076179 RepID=A0A644W6M3_9ZZZZ
MMCTLTYNYVKACGEIGKENDNEVKGTGNQQDYGMRIYDPKLGRFLSADPLIVQGQKYAWYSPYQFAGNNPIWAVDLDGLEPVIPMTQFLELEQIEAASNFFWINAFKLAYPKQISRDLISHYAYGKGSNYQMSEAEMIEVHPVHKSLQQADNFKTLVEDKLADPNTKSVTVKGMRIGTYANTNGTLNEFSIMVDGTFTKTENGGWSFSGTMNFYDEYDFREEDGKNDGRNNRCAIARALLPGQSYFITSDKVSISQKNTNSEIDWFNGVSDENVGSNLEWLIEDEGVGREAGSESK